MTLLIIGLLLVLLFMGEPLYVVLGAATVLCFALITQLPADANLLNHLQREIIEKVNDLADKDVMLAIPFFVIAGAIMTRGQISAKLIDVARATVGWLPGGLAVAAVLACTLFAAISGSSPATVIAIGSMMVPALLADGYQEKFSLGLVTTAGSLGILIPPSIPMLVYSVVKTSGEKIDVGELFLAGVGPGLMISAMLIVYSMVRGSRFKVRAQRFSLRAIGRACRDGIWALSLPAVILGGIYSGLFTTTAAAAVSVIYAYVIEAFIHRELSSRDLGEVLAESARMMGALLIIVVMALGLNSFLADEKIPDHLALWLREKQLGPIAFLLAVNVLLIIAGCVMDIVSAISIFVPLLAPVAESMGIDPIHLAIIFIVNLEMGYMTPPIGLNLFVTASLFKKSLGDVVRAVVPTLLIMLVSVGIVTFVPTVQLGFVNLLRGEQFYEPFPSGRPRVTADTVDEPGPPGKPPADKQPAGGKKLRSLEDLMDEADKALERPKDRPGNKPQGTKGGGMRSLEDLMDEADKALD
jgi:C4-dicarboxylate transporter DctM subunit